MKSAEEWKAELWEGQDYIVTGFGIQHPGVFRKREADLIVAILHSATPLIQLDAWKQGMTDAAKIVDASRSGSVMDTRTAIEDIYLKRDNAKSV